MLASKPVDLEVLVLLFLFAVLFSCTRMERISPTRKARLSLTIDCGAAFPFQSESARRTLGAQTEVRMPNTQTIAKGNRAATAANVLLKRDKDNLFILHLSTKFTTALRIAHPHHLAANPILHHFNLERNQQAALLQQRFHKLAPFD